MIPELGLFSLILALLMAVTLGVLPLAGAALRWQAGMATARPAAIGLFVLTLLAVGCLDWSFYVNDYSVLYVAANSDASLPLAYRLAALWGSHEGSLLLWLFLLTLWTLAVALFSKGLPLPFVARVLAVMGWISVGFLVFLLSLSNPFTRLIPPALQGRDLNPLLQDPGMTIHPPVLYLGYVGFSVAFAFAIAALLSGKLDALWARWARPWTMAAWMFLTLGILLGSAWAYYTLGWGGWWFWDPVENASFMPWLVGTALIHSLIVTERRGAFRSWTVLLAIAAFSLSLLGTFMVRSGVLTSVHAFAVDPSRGLYILIFMAVVVGGSLALYAWRAPTVGLGGRFAVLSRETLLLANNVTLAVAACAVLLGTLYPVVLDVLGLGKISVGPPYFEAVFVPLMTPAIFLMGVGPVARWKEARLPDLSKLLAIAFVISLITAIFAPLAASGGKQWGSPRVMLGLWLAMWSVASALAHAWQRVQAGDGSSPRHLLRHLSRQPRAWWGMLLAHIGVGVFIAGVTLANGFEAKREIRMAVGETVEAGGYDFTFRGVGASDGPNYHAQRGVFEVSRGSHHVVTLEPEQRLYTVQNTPLAHAAIDSRLTRDLFIALGDPLDDGAWTVRIQVKPGMAWIWAGCVLLALGGLLAACDRRYRRARLADAAREIAGGGMSSELSRGKAPNGEEKSLDALAPRARGEG